MRFDLLNVVGSRPARRARPEGGRPARSASRSIALHTWPWVSIVRAFGCLAMGKTRQLRQELLAQSTASGNSTRHGGGLALELAAARRYMTSRNLRENPKGLKDKQEPLGCA